MLLFEKENQFSNLVAVMETCFLITKIRTKIFFKATKIVLKPN